MAPIARVSPSQAHAREYAAWLLLFVGTRALFLLTHGGSYIDEYLHAFSGQAWWETGELASFYTGEVYRRGRLISFAVGLVFAGLGPTLWAAKLVPLCLGALAFACTIRLCRGLWPARPGLRYAAYGLCLLSPFGLFNAFYVRMYVLYEAGLLLSLVLLIDLQRSVEARQQLAHPLRRIAALCAGLGAVNGAVVWGGLEPGAVVVPAASALGLAVLAVGFRRHADRAPTARQMAVRLSVLVFAAVALFAWPPVQQAARFWLHGELHFTSREDHKLTHLFFQQLPLLTFFFGLGVVVLLRRCGWAGRTLGTVAVSLLAMHLLASPDLQITRGVLYFMPLYLTVAGAGMLHPDALALPRGLRLAALALGVANLALAYPERFFSEPGIPTEISYIDYAAVYADAAEHCQDTPLLDASPSPHIGLLHGVRPTAALFTPSRSKQDKMVETRDDGQKQTVYGHIPVVTRLPALTGPACLLVRTASAGRMLSRAFRKALKGQQVLGQHAGITLYRIHPAFARRHADFQR